MAKTKNDWFEIDKAALNHYKKTHDMQPEQEIEWWSALMDKFSYDMQAVREIEEGIFAAKKKIWKAEKTANEEALSSYKKSSDAWIKYQTEVNNMSVDGQIESYKRQLSNYNAMVSQMVSSTLYSSEEIKKIWDSFYEYKSGVDLKIGILENEKNHAVYEKWQSDAKNWKLLRDTYGDWYEVGDNPVKFYMRSIERIQQMYDGGYIGWQEYSDDTMFAKLNLHEAKTDMADELLKRQKQYISDLKKQFSNEEKALSGKWEAEDRRESMTEISHQLGIYKNAVTQKGMDKYNSLRESMKKLKREEEMYNLEKTHTEKISKLEESYEIVEANKKYLLAQLENSGVNIESIISSVNYDLRSMENTIASLFAQTISAIKSVKVASNSYSDNRNINISANSEDVVNALKNKVGLTIAHSKYF